MTLTDTIRLVELVASNQPPIKSIIRNDIFRLNSLPDAKYSVFGWTQGNHSSNQDSFLYTYRFTFFYIDRLTADQSNELEIQSVGIQVLDNVLRLLAEQGIDTDGDWQFTTFNQRFIDECAGVYCSVGLSVPVNGICADTFFDFNEDFNEDFNARGISIY